MSKKFKSKFGHLYFRIKGICLVTTCQSSWKTEATHKTDMSSYYSFLNLAFMVAHGSFYKQDVPDRKCGKVSADINPAFFFNHLAATNITGFSETLSLAKNSLSLARKPLSLTEKFLSFGESD